MLKYKERRRVVRISQYVVKFFATEVDASRYSFMQSLSPKLNICSQENRESKSKTRSETGLIVPVLQLNKVHYCTTTVLLLFRITNKLSYSSYRTILSYRTCTNLFVPNLKNTEHGESPSATQSATWLQHGASATSVP
jgi:hypothetical protein